MKPIAHLQHRYIPTILSGLSAGVGMLVAPLWFFTVIGLGSFFYILWHKTTSTREALMHGFLFGICTSGAGLLALLEIFPHTTNAVSFLATAISVLFLWTVPTIALGITTAPIAYLLFRTRKNLFAPAIAIGAWVVNEELKMWAWLIVTYGTGAIPEPHLSISALAYAFADAPYVLQLAENGGLLFLTLTLALFAVTLAHLWFSIQKKNTAIPTLVLMGICAVVLILPLFQHSSITRSSKTMRIAVFSSTIGMKETRNDTELITKLTGSEAPEVLIFPEGKDFKDVANNAIQLRDLLFNTQKETLSIHSSESGNGGIHRNTITYESSVRGVVGTQDKHFLMPQGEYRPYLSDLFFMLIPNSAVHTISTTRAVVHGTTLTGVPFDSLTFGTLLCSELFSPHLYKRLVDTRGASVLVNLADPIWFRGSHLLFNKTIQVAKVHAVQHRAYFLSAQNSAPSFIIDPHGRLIAKTAWNTTDVLLFDLPTPTKE